MFHDAYLIKSKYGTEKLLFRTGGASVVVLLRARLKILVFMLLCSSLEVFWGWSSGSRTGWPWLTEASLSPHAFLSHLTSLSQTFCSNGEANRESLVRTSVVLPRTNTYSVSSHFLSEYWITKQNWGKTGRHQTTGPCGQSRGWRFLTVSCLPQGNVKKKKPLRYTRNNIAVKIMPQCCGERCIGGEDGMQEDRYILPSPLYLMRTSWVPLATRFCKILQQRNI